MQSSSLISLSPSFNSYSNAKIAEIAARVVGEFEFSSEEEFYDEFYFEKEGDSECVETEKENGVVREEDLDGAEEEEFEFVSVNRDTSPISADEIFHNGQIRPVYPVFNREMFLGRVESQERSEKEEKRVRNSASEQPPVIRLPLRKLFIEERETTMTMMTTSSCSSSEADDLDGIPAESYCVWRPKEAAAAEGQCKKSSSAGSNSKRWKFKDLLNRSHSDGSKGNFVILSHGNSGRKKQSEEIENETPVSGGKAKSAAAAPLQPPVRVYIRNGGEKRRSYLPYRQELVGLFGNVNGVSKNLQPF